MPATLLSKVWDLHAVRRLPTGQTELFVGLHLVHEVTSPQAFEMLRARAWKVPFPSRTVATVDHIVPTASLARPFADAAASTPRMSFSRSSGRSGNASLEEIVMILKLRSDKLPFTTGIVTTELFSSSQLLGQITGEPVQSNKAILGRNAFAHEAAIHQDAPAAFAFRDEAHPADEAGYGHGV